jgi:hypothetical protein
MDRRAMVREAASDLFRIETESPNFWREIIGLDGFEPIYPHKKDMGMRRRQLNLDFEVNLRCVLNLSAQAGREEDWELVGAVIGMKGEFVGGEIPLALLHLIKQKDWLGVGLFVKERINETYEDIVRRVERSCE